MQHDDEREKRRARRGRYYATAASAGTRIVWPRLEIGKSSLTPCKSASDERLDNVTRSSPCHELHAEGIRTPATGLQSCSAGAIARVARHRNRDEIERRVAGALRDARARSLVRCASSCTLDQRDAARCSMRARRTRSRGGGGVATTAAPISVAAHAPLRRFVAVAASAAQE